ncbi:phage major capsid protein [Planobispora rosea]|uniref:phage major capsid protein n=1 Tax=Planobispora rosea TaxID=35762 RepID=UPI0016706143|nr:phage major capsid protein [Planobispora rosea]
MTLEEIRARLTAIEDERRSLDEAAGEAALGEQAQARWDELDAEETDLRGQLDEAERRERVAESRQRWRTVQIGQPVTPFDGADVTRMGGRELVDRARAVLGDDSASGHLGDAQRTRLERLLQTRNDNVDGALLARRLLVTEDPDYRAAFMRLVSRATPVLTPEQSRAVQRFEEFRAMSIGVDAGGGYGVPVLIDPTIILTAQGSPNDFFNLARVETITTDAWKGVSSAGVTWQFRAEAAAATDNSPTLAQPAVPVYRADGYIPYSLEVDQDYPGFAAEMSRLLGEGYSELLVSKFTTGTGVNEPTGIVTALDATPASEVATGVGGTLAAGDINKVWAALPIRYRNARCAWMTSTNVNNLIQQLGAGGNDSAFTVSFTEEGVVVLKGRRAYLNDYMAAMPAGTAAGNIAVVGDWSNYLIAQRAGMSVELVPHVFDATTNTPTGQRAWFAWARVGADSINDSAFRLLQNKTT